MKIHRGRCVQERNSEIPFRYCQDVHRYVCVIKGYDDEAEKDIEHDFDVTEESPPMFWPACSQPHLDEWNA